MSESTTFTFSSLLRNRSLRVVLLHVFLLAIVASALYAFGIIRFLPAEDNLLRWDVIWYEQIMREGYHYSETGTSNAAFFPMLPYLWRLTGLSLLGMAMLNGALFLAAFAWLSHQLNLPGRLQLLLLSTPALLFMSVPYTEALFFLFASLLLVGLRQKRLMLWILGLLGCGLTRSATTMFTPALLFMVLLWASQPGQLRTALRWGAMGLLTVCASIGIVALAQWRQVGEPWAFFKAQHHWGHFLQVPTLPLGSGNGINMLWLDAAALWLGVAAIGTCTWLAWGWLRQLQGKPARPLLPLEVVFALGYCVSVTLFILLYQGGNLANIARYLLGTPFLVVLVGFTASRPDWSRRRYLLVALGTMVLWQAFGLYTQGFDNFSTPQALWYFGLITGYVLVYLGWRQLRWQGEVTLGLYVCNLVAMLHLLEGWLQFYVVF